MPDERGGRGVGRFLGRASEGMRSATDALTGRSVEQSVAEYTEQFAEVAVGLHEDIKRVEGNVADVQARVERLDQEPRGEVNNPWPLRLAAVSMLLAIAALVVAIWAAI